MLMTYINGISCGIILIIIGIFIYNKSKIDKKQIIKMIISVLIYSLLSLINRQIGDNIVRFIFAYLLMILMYKFNFNESLNRLLIGALIAYVIMAFSDIIVMILVLLFTYITNMDVNVVMDVSNTFYINIFVVVITLLILYINRIKLKEIVKNIENKVNVSIIMIPILLIITLSTLFFKIPTNNFKIDIEFYINITLIIIMCLITIYILKQRNEKHNLSEKYQKLNEYSTIIETMTEDYRIKQHENKNQLLIIKGMVNSRNKELHQYIDKLLETNKDSKYRWINNLKYIKLPEVKSFINYKIVEMESKNISVEVNINKSLQKVKYNSLSLKDKEIIYTLLGVYLDNALESAEKSKTKEVIINIYDDKENIYFELYNTYKGKIDLNKIDNYGYSSKGGKHGVGLHIVKSLLNNNDKYKSIRKLEDKYFIQIVTIKKNMN